MAREVSTKNKTSLLLVFTCLGILAILYRIQQATLTSLDQLKQEVRAELRQGVRRLEDDVDSLGNMVVDDMAASAASFKRPAPVYAEEKKSANKPAQRPPKTWISMSVCYSANTQIRYLNKQHYPYRYAATLSSRLWHNLTDHDVVMHVVYDEKDKDNQEMHDYVKALRSEGTLVALRPSGQVPCVQNAKFQRMFVFALPEVQSDDLVVTSDVDAFLMVGSMFDVLKERNKYKVWVFQYEYAVNANHLFPMCFIAMKAGTWKDVLEVDTPKQLLDKYNASIDLAHKDPWYFDQFVISHILLKKQLCWMDRQKKIWSYSLLTPPADKYDDSATCYHGMEYANCNLGRRSAPGGCRWWHFHPHNKEADFKRKYDEIIQAALADKKNRISKAGVT